MLYRIKTCLTSTNLTALSADPNDLERITSNHFLIGSPLVHRNLMKVNINRLDRWVLFRSLAQSCWRRWHSEYLRTLWRERSGVRMVLSLALVISFWFVRIMCRG